MNAGLPIRLLTALGALSMLHATVLAQAFPPVQQKAPAQGSSFPPANNNAGSGGFPAQGTTSAPASTPAPASAPGPSAFPAPGASSAPGGFGPAPAPGGGGGFGSPGGGLGGGGLGGMGGGGMGGLGGGGAPQGPTTAQQACLKEFTTYRDDFARRAKAFQAATKAKRKPSAEEACKLISGVTQAAQKWRVFVDTKGSGCGMPPDLGPQIKTQETQVATVQKNICEAAARGPAPAAGPSLSDVLGTPSLPEAPQTKRSGGNTFDTINGNALTR